MAILAKTDKNGHLFDVFQTREDFKAATGQDAPQYDPTKPWKFWFDANPPTADDTGFVTYKVFSYTRNMVRIDANGNPIFTRVFITPADARNVNIPIKGVGSIDNDNPKGEVPVPIRDLSGDEKWTVENPFSPPSIEKKLPTVQTNVTNQTSSLDLTPVLSEMEELKQLLLYIVNALFPKK